ncbi:hypothetical protein [Aliiroseovarius sp. 2305UL8-7]|uniref:hypothetical protein n=1 Tax=Aliiroseovarius conchicola TaxID=3121637 RepID=UPI003526FE89
MSKQEPEQTKLEAAKSAAPAAAPPPAAPDPIIHKPLARPARLRPRHRRLIGSFFVVVLLPLLATAWYMYARAKDQYVSYVAFSVRSEDVGSALDLFGGLSAFGSSGSEDADILYEFIQSRELVRATDEALDLRSIYSTTYDVDPIFSFDADGTIEDLSSYWKDMVKIFYDNGTGLIELRVHAFDAKKAQEISEFIFVRSSDMINELSAIAREDATRYAREELERAVARLREARQAVTEFRSKNQIVDPAAEIGAQTGLLTALQTRLSNALITYDLLKESAGENDPRLEQAILRIDVIRQRIDEERKKYASNDTDGGDFSSLVGEYEGLAVDREFAERSYLAALAAYDAALTEAQRKSRYLAAYIKPTLAERPEYPKRLVMVLLVSGFLFFSWSIGALIYYAIRDRR